MVPREYFDDEITIGVSRGTMRHLRHSRFSIVRLPVGYGKTLIAVMTAVGIAMQHNNRVQIGVIAPKAKRLDKSFDEALDSASEYFGVTFDRVLINGEETGTFAGLSRELGGETPEGATVDQQRRARRKAIKDKALEIAKTPTVFILDETHMTLRDSTSVTSKSFTALLNMVDKAGGYVKVVGLTATPFDKSVLDTIGYLVFNGDYSSRENFYTTEILDYKSLKMKGNAIEDIENMIVGRNFKIHPDKFVNYQRVINKVRKIIYSPRAPKNFHIPENKILTLKVPLSEAGIEHIEYLKMIKDDDGFASKTEERLEFIKAMTTDSAMIDMSVRIAKSDKIKQPLFFYQFNAQRDALVEKFEAEGIDYLEVNGSSHSYFSDFKDDLPVLVQYGSGATAFEAKKSNTSVYVGLPDSSINFDQSLGRNARRGQDMTVINNYILAPQGKTNRNVPQFTTQYKRIMNKMTQNAIFLQNFETDWGVYEKR
jgi:DNA or RNA helicases of superfamily II